MLTTYTLIIYKSNFKNSLDVGENDLKIQNFFDRFWSLYHQKELGKTFCLQLQRLQCQDPKILLSYLSCFHVSVLTHEGKFHDTLF